jgi:hypothetical protein
LLSQAQAVACPASRDFIARISFAGAHAKRLLAQAQERQAAAYNRRRRDLSFKVGDKVLLSAEALRALSDQGPVPEAAKLRSLYQGPLEVLEVVNPLAYRLRLPPNSRAHDVFPLVFIRPYQMDTGRHRDPPPPPQPLYQEDGEDYWEVEAIVGERTAADGHVEFLVRWKGFSAAHDSFEPRSSVSHTTAFKAYMRKKAAAARTQRS